MNLSQNEFKKSAAEAALKYIEPGMIVGVGTGSTVHYFIEALALIKNKIDGAVASSIATEQQLKKYHIPVYDLNAVFPLPIYIDGADEINEHLQMIKGGGAALTREKIVAFASEKFICIADQSKKVARLGKFPLPIEVIPMARSFVAREVVKIGGHPVYREGLTTDNMNVIIDVWDLDLTNPVELEKKLNNIPGVVCNGVFAMRPADLLLLATTEGVKTYVNNL